MKSVIVCLLAIFSVGCSSVYEVEKGGEEQPGIPVYEVVQTVHTTKVYEEPWAVLTYEKTSQMCQTVTNGTCSAWSAAQKDKFVKYVVPECADTLINEFNQQPTPALADGKVRRVMIAGKHNGECKPKNGPFGFRTKAEVLTVINDRPKIYHTSTKKETKYENGDLYYINVEKPWIGTSTATIKLSEHGRLTEMTASVEDKTVETILGALPIKEFISHDLGLDEALQEEAAMGAGVGETRILSSSLSYDTLIYVYKLGSPLDVFEASTRSHSQKKEGKNENAVSFSGSVVLPKAANPI